MDFILSEEQKMLQTAIGDFALGVSLALAYSILSSRLEASPQAIVPASCGLLIKDLSG